MDVSRLVKVTTPRSGACMQEDYTCLHDQQDQGSGLWRQWECVFHKLIYNRTYNWNTVLNPAACVNSGEMLAVKCWR